MKRAAIFLLLVSQIVNAQATENLSAEQILEKNLQATGGRAAWSKVITLVKSGTITAHNLRPRFTPGPTPPVEQTGSIRIYMEPPDRYLYYQSNAVLGLTYHGCYRYSRWNYVPMRGIHHFTGINRNCDVVLVPGRWSERYHKMEVKGLKTVNGRLAYEVRVSHNEQNATLYFDAENFLLLRSTGVLATGGWVEVAHQTDYLDYGEVDGLKFAYTLVDSFNGGQSRTHFGEIYVNAKIADNIFEPESNNHDKK